MENSNSTTLQLIKSKLRCKDEYLSTLDSKFLDEYKRLNKTIYGYASFREIPQKMFDLIDEHSSIYTDGFDDLLRQTLQSNLQFSSAF